MFNFDYPEPLDLNCVEEAVKKFIGQLKTKENYDKISKEIEQSMKKPKIEYCDFCGKQFDQQWDSVTNTYFFTNKYPFIDKFICGSCAFKAKEWLFSTKQNKKQPTVVKQKEVDKENKKCNNCLYEGRMIKCHSCTDNSNFKEKYAR